MGRKRTRQRRDDVKRQLSSTQGIVSDPRAYLVFPASGDACPQRCHYSAARLDITQCVCNEIQQTRAVKQPRIMCVSIGECRSEATGTVSSPTSTGLTHRIGCRLARGRFPLAENTLTFTGSCRSSGLSSSAFCSIMVHALRRDWSQ
jgi:hypothetical protein